MVYVVPFESLFRATEAPACLRPQVINMSGDDRDVTCLKFVAKGIPGNCAKLGKIRFNQYGFMCFLSYLNQSASASAMHCTSIPTVPSESIQQDGCSITIKIVQTYQNFFKMLFLNNETCANRNTAQESCV